MFTYPTVSVLTVNSGDSLSAFNTVARGSSLNIHLRLTRKSPHVKWVSRIVHELYHFQNVLLPSTAFTFVVLASLRGRRLEVVGERENGRARGRHVRGEGAPSPLACLLFARSLILSCLCPLLPSAGCYAGYVLAFLRFHRR